MNCNNCQRRMLAHERIMLSYIIQKFRQLAQGFFIIITNQDRVVYLPKFPKVLIIIFPHFTGSTFQIQTKASCVFYTDQNNFYQPTNLDLNLNMLPNSSELPVFFFFFSFLFFFPMKQKTLLKQTVKTQETKEGLPYADLPASTKIT